MGSNIDNETPLHLPHPERECEIDPSLCLYGCVYEHRGRAWRDTVCVGVAFYEFRGVTKGEERKKDNKKTGCM